jgi:hypothetical protein
MLWNGILWPWFKSNTVIQRQRVAVPNANLGKQTMINFVLMQITPEIAKAFLAGNTDNRKLASRTVEVLARDMVNGCWRVTHQCIAISESGLLIDGQHRLSAVVSSGKTVPMYVAYYGGEEKAMGLPIDLHKKRSHTDILKCNPRFAEIANSFAWLFTQRMATTSEAAQIIAACEPHLSRLHEFVSDRPKSRGAAGARSAIVYKMMSDPDNADKYLHLYRAFCLLNFDDMNSSIMALVKSLDGDEGRFNGAQGRIDLFVRVVYAFDLSQPDRKLIRLTEDVKAALIDRARKYLAAVVHGDN